VFIFKHTKLRNKKIGKKFRISCAQYRKDTAKIYIYEYDKNKRKFIKYTIGEFPNKPSNLKALSIYNSTKTVDHINQLLKK